jgi:lysozyme
MSEAARVVEGPFELPEAISADLVADLKRDEGCRWNAYQDTLGNWTIGYGHCSPEVKKGLVWTQAQCEAALVADIREAMAQLDAKLPWWRSLDPVRADAVCNMAFNMGLGDINRGLLSFRNTLEAIRRHDYGLAAVGLLASLWARQVGKRAERIAFMIRTGTRP